MPSQLVVSVGPVQEFIASARRSRDLWFGSWLLSELSKAAALHLATTYGLESLIFPTVHSLAELAPAPIRVESAGLNVANKVVAILPMDDAKPAALATEQAVKRRLDDLRKQVWNSMKAPQPNPLQPADQQVGPLLNTRELANKQIDELLEFAWVAQTYADPAQYPQTRQYAEALLAARKVTRDFKQSVGTTQPKSSLDGIRESVISEDRFPRPDALDRKAKVDFLYKTYGAGPAERMSGVDLLKRLGSRGVHFPSTSHVAALPFLQLLTRTNRLPALAGLADAMQQKSVALESVKSTAPDGGEPAYDVSFLFTSRLDDALLDESQADAVATLLDDFFKQNTNGVRPMPYYALLQADGDRMGAVIDHQASLEKHRDLSRALARFAVGVKRIVEQTHGGALVYCGGDDVLAFLPLHTALACAAELAATFTHADDGLGNFKDAAGHAPTMSAGLVVAHHLEPLSDVLRLVRQAESDAKSVKKGNRNALALTLSKRSGADRTVFGNWGMLDARLNDFVDLHRRDLVPDGAAYDLARIKDEMGINDDMPPDATLLQAARQEAIRILERKRSAHGASFLKENEKVFARLVARIETDLVPVHHLAQELTIAGFFAQAANMAYGEPAEVPA